MWGRGLVGFVGVDGVEVGGDERVVGGGPERGRGRFGYVPCVPWRVNFICERFLQSSSSACWALDAGLLLSVRCSGTADLGRLALLPLP